MHHSSAISSADAFKFRDCDTNILLLGITYTAVLEMMHNCRFVFEPKSTRTELIEGNIDSSAFVS